MSDDAGSWSADDAVTHLYHRHYAEQVRLATLLLGDQGRAEEVVQEALIAVHRRWRRLREPHRAAGYLQRSVVNGCRSAHRRRGVEARHLPDPPGPDASAESYAVRRDEQRRLAEALDGLSTRQREVLVHRYYLDLSEADIASALGISRGAVKTHASRGLAALRTTWETA